MASPVSNNVQIVRFDQIDLKKSHETKDATDWKREDGVIPSHGSFLTGDQFPEETQDEVRNDEEGFVPYYQFVGTHYPTFQQQNQIRGKETEINPATKYIDSDPFNALVGKKAPDFRICEGNYSKTIALHSNNYEANRYPDAVPYDRNIYAPEFNGREYYLNASVICDAYVATQLPLQPFLIEEFWMAVAAKTGAVFSLVTPEEQKDAYWEMDETIINDQVGMYDEPLAAIRGMGKDEVIYPKCFDNNECIVKRKFALYVRKNGSEALEEQPHKTINHYHYENWDDGGVPKNKSAFKVLLKLLDEEKDLPFIHCSAGVGRTGTLIALHILYKKVREEINNGKDPIIDPVAVIKEMRKDRFGMVQKRAQFNFIYECIHELAVEYKHSKEMK